jgi:Methylase involved in ubiquinone/menaquinone biosynthesis
LFAEKNIKIFNFLSKKVGIKKNSYSEKITDVLLDEEKLPIEDLFFNHIVSVHYLENASNLKKNLRELWRVLAPEGKIYIVLPNKKSSWNISSGSPFSSGFGFF